MLHFLLSAYLAISLCNVMFFMTTFTFLILPFSLPRDDSPNNQQSGPTWGPDKDILECLICKAPFSFMTRRHHCRRCGKCVCSKCAPAKNSRPIIEWGFRDSVRHCKLCYVSPIVKWHKIGGDPPSPLTKALSLVSTKS